MSAGEWSPTPARGYAWPPFEPGHELSMRHGAHSPRRVDPLAAELVAETLAAPGCAYLSAPRWTAAVWAWARAEAKVILLDTWLAGRPGGGIEEDGSVSGALNALLRWETAAANCRARLGLDPLSAARLGRDITAATMDMARLLSDVGEDEDGDAEQG